jgi:hypothetical protein
MWPITDQKLREGLTAYRRILQNNLRRLNLRNFGIMLAIYGSSREKAQASFVVLCPEVLPQTGMTEGIPQRFGLIPLRYTHKERSENILEKGYTQNPYPGLAIGACRTAA